MSDVPSDMDSRLAKGAAGEPPEGPSGVWLEYADGARFTDLPTLYLGTDEDGLATFQLLVPRDEPIAKIGAERWPGRTSMLIPRMLPGGQINP